MGREQLQAVARARVWLLAAAAGAVAGTLRVRLKGAKVLQRTMLPAYDGERAHRRRTRSPNDRLQDPSHRALLLSCLHRKAFPRTDQSYEWSIELDCIRGCFTKKGLVNELPLGYDNVNNKVKRRRPPSLEMDFILILLGLRMSYGGQATARKKWISST